MHDWLSGHQFFHIPVLRWAYAALVTLGGFLLTHGILRALSTRLRKLAARTGNSALTIMASVLKLTSATLLFLLFVLIGLYVLQPSPQVARWLDSLVFLVVGLQVGLWASHAIRAWTANSLSRTDAGAGNPVVMTMLSWFARTMVWALLLLALLDNVGVNVTAFIASLGIGGIAVALGLQNVLKDLFASLAIGLDKPFEIGEFIQFGDFLGTIVHVGIKTTRLRSLSGEEISISNSALLDQTIRNYSRMQTRRIVFGFGLPIDTPRGKVQQVIDAVRDIVGAAENTRLDRAHFQRFGPSSLDFEVVHIVQSPDYNVYMNIQQGINLALMERLEALGLAFAVPVRTLRAEGAVCVQGPEGGGSSAG